MRKQQKNIVLDFIKTLQDTQRSVGQALERGDKAVAQEFLVVCQQGAIQLGEIIENAEGVGFVTVGYLEQYCERLFLLYDLFEQNVQTGADVAYREMEAQLERVEESVINDIPVRLEVVFLPYKASMWDSLESVWMAADQDPNCDAYVIPIPYYDKNPDGSFREMHYEGELYPDYVPITRYDRYDFAERKPDMIYIHNPYDNYNIVTSVHPFFYSKNLKQFTEKLVYIPYFVLAEINPANKSAVQGMKHFVTVPGVHYADTVIVQSEDMRQVYIDVMTEVSGEETRPVWEKKILGTGSPKFDKVHRTEKETLQIPEEWQGILKKPDGSDKKVIFYNTSVTALLQYDEEMLAKMQNVFEVFKEKQAEVALLWRPHPLIKATIQTMRPRLWEEYERIVEQYRREGWGIYDDTADLDRAIALCDGYFGDESSVVQLCRNVGRPVMIQNVYVQY